MPTDFFATAASAEPPPPIILLDEQQQQILREGYTNQSRGTHDGSRRTRSEATSKAPPPPTPTYLRTDFTTGRQKSRELHNDANTLPTRQLSTPTMKESPSDMQDKDKQSFSAPIDLEPTAMPFISSSDDRKDEGPDPSRDFRGNRSNLKLSIRYMIIGAVVGIVLGIIFAHVGVSDVVAQWISLPGDLFLRAINSLVVPYVFCSMAVAVGDIVFVGKVSIIGLKTLKIFATGWIVSTVLGLGVAITFRSYFRLEQKFASPNANAVGLSCSNGLMLEMGMNQTIACSAKPTTDLSLTNAFVLNDLNDVFATTKDAVITDLTLSCQLIATLESVVPNNIFAALADGDLLAVMTFAMLLGSIAGRSYFRNAGSVKYLYLVLLQSRNTFFLAMEWVIWVTPVAVVSTIAGAFASNQAAVSQLPKVYMFPIACVTATVLQILVVYPLIIFVLTRCNPYAHMHYMLRSYLFAFGSSSSLATAPVTLGCIQKARVCSRSIATFVVSVGVVTNMSASGWYFPIGVVFLAESSGNGDQLTVLHFIAIFFLTIVACAGTPPVPNGGMVLMSTMYKAVLGLSTLPSTWALYVAMNFFADRLATICNVNDDIMALKVIAENTDETVTGNHHQRAD